MMGSSCSAPSQAGLLATTTTAGHHQRGTGSAAGTPGWRARASRPITVASSASPSASRADIASSRLPPRTRGASSSSAASNKKTSRESQLVFAGGERRRLVLKNAA
ncbi:hypothetical protein MASR1M50_23410 [Burkholderiales bacterium]